MPVNTTSLLSMPPLIEAAWVAAGNGLLDLLRREARELGVIETAFASLAELSCNAL